MQIGADAAPSDDRGQLNSFHVLARVETHAAFESFGRRLPALAGLQAQVEMITRSETLLTFLGRPWSPSRNVHSESVEVRQSRVRPSPNGVSRLIAS